MIDNAAKMNITELCYFFNQCKQGASAEIRALKASLYQRFSQQAKKIPFACPVCVKLFDKVFEMILNNRTEVAIISALEEVCYILPSNERQKCVNFFEEYADFIVQEIIAGTTPKLLCISLGLCDFVDAPQLPIQVS